MGWRATEDEAFTRDAGGRCVKGDIWSEKLFVCDPAYAKRTTTTFHRRLRWKPLSKSSISCKNAVGAVRSRALKFPSWSSLGKTLNNPNHPITHYIWTRFLMNIIYPIDIAKLRQELDVLPLNNTPIQKASLGWTATRICARAWSSAGPWKPYSILLNATLQTYRYA